MNAFSHLEVEKLRRSYFGLSPIARAPIVAALLAGLAVALYVFAHVQDIWLDESTQLSGISPKLPTPPSG
jgi:hypothetical protein